MLSSCKNLLRPLYRRYLAMANRGDAVTCNLCNRSFSSLRPLVGRHADGSKFILEGETGSCWFCNSYPRIRQLYHWLINDYNIASKENLKLLHIAPEQQLSDQLRRMPNINCVCIDKHCPGYSYPDYVADGDICALSFPDSTFDLVICNHVLEHVADDILAMDEINRVLKPGAKAILMVPINMAATTTIEEEPGHPLPADEREKRFGQYDHVRLYGTDYFTRLRNAGFDVERVGYNDRLTQQFGFSPGEEVIVCTKRSSRE